MLLKILLSHKAPVDASREAIIAWNVTWCRLVLPHPSFDQLSGVLLITATKLKNNTKTFFHQKPSVFNLMVHNSDSEVYMFTLQSALVLCTTEQNLDMSSSDCLPPSLLPQLHYAYQVQTVMMRPRLLLHHLITVALVLPPSLLTPRLSLMRGMPGERWDRQILSVICDVLICFTRKGCSRFVLNSAISDRQIE